MPATLRLAVVEEVVERQPGLVRVQAGGAPCVAYPALTGPVAVGDEVVVNTQARELGLGSGGFDVVVANLTRGLGLAAEPGAHVMAHPYAPLQAAVRHVEEDGIRHGQLDGLPVVCCSLHSQVAPVCAGLGEGQRTVYVQLGGGALPVALSDTVRALRARTLIAADVAVAPCLAASHQAASVASALLWARDRGAGAVVCAIGPGIVGTGSPYGHGGLAVAEAANAASALGGRPVVAARLSAADPRERHRGLSHHTESALRLCLGAPLVAWPAGAANAAGDGDLLSAAPPGARTVDASGWRAATTGLPLSHMGRGPDDDPLFFEAAYAAGLLAARLAEGAA